MAQDMMRNDHIVAESTNILSTHFGGGHIYSIAIEEDMDNGLLVARGEEYEDEVWGAKEYAAGDEALLLLNPPVMSIVSAKSYTTEDRFYNEAGDRVRAYALNIGDRITLSENAFETAPAAKQYVTYDAADKKYVVGAKATDKFCAQVLGKVARGNMVMYKIQVVSL